MVQTFQLYKGEELLNLFSKGPCWDTVKHILTRDITRLMESYVKSGNILKSSAYKDFMLTNFKIIKKFREDVL